MATDQMRVVEAELDRVRTEIDKLRVEEALLLKMLGKMHGAPVQPSQRRTRSPSVTPVVFDIMRQAGSAGATTVEVDAKVRERVPTVAKYTVSATLSRLKSEGALVYWGDRYYEKHFAPKEEQNYFDRKIRAVN